MAGFDAEQLQDIAVVDREDHEVGTVVRVYADVDTGEPTWVTVQLGPWARDLRTVPLATAELREGRLHVPYTREKMEDSPIHLPDEDLGEEKVANLSEFYEL